jgi:hypothetical protein
VHFVQKYVSPALPKFLYFRDCKLREGKANLHSLSADSFKPEELARFERLFTRIAEVL